MDVEQGKLLCLPRAFHGFGGGCFLDQVRMCYEESNQGNLDMKIRCHVDWRNYVEDYSSLTFTGGLVGPPKVWHIENVPELYENSYDDWVGIEQFWPDRKDIYLSQPTKVPDKVWTSLDGVEFKAVGFSQKRDYRYIFIVEIVKWLPLEEREQRMKTYFETNKVFLGICRSANGAFPLDHIFWCFDFAVKAHYMAEEAKEKWKNMYEDYSEVSFSGDWVDPEGRIRDQPWQWYRVPEDDVYYNTKNRDKVWTSPDGVKFKAVGFTNRVGSSYVFVVQILNWPTRKQRTERRLHKDLSL